MVRRVLLAPVAPTGRRCCDESTNDCSSLRITADAAALLTQLAHASFDRGSLEELRK
jgi:hypothetical protein